MAIAKALLIDISTNREEKAHRSFVIYRFPFRVGRESRNPKRLTEEGIEASLKSLPNNDLYIRDPGPVTHISREHFEIDLKDGEFYVIDRGSKSGTIVNGERIGANERSYRIKLGQKENLIIAGSEQSPFRFKLILYPEPLKARILVADDEPQVVQTLTKFLQVQGHEVKWANSGLDAIRQIVSDRPDLILLDWMMPHIEGVEICRRIKSNPTTSQIPIIILTARPYPEDKVIGFDSGADDFLTKPFDMRELDARIRRLLSLSSKLKTVHSESGFANERAFREEVDMRLSDEQLADTVSIVLVKIQGLGSYQAEHGQVETGALLSDIWRMVGAMPAHIGASQSIVGSLANDFLAILTLREWGPKLEESLRTNLARKYPAMHFDIRTVSNENRIYPNFWQMLEAKPAEKERKSGLFRRPKR